MPQQDELKRVFGHFLAMVDAFRHMEGKAREMQGMAQKDSVADALFTTQEQTWSLAADWLAAEIRNQANQTGIDLRDVPQFVIQPIPF